MKETEYSLRSSIFALHCSVNYMRCKIEAPGEKSMVWVVSVISKEFQFCQIKSSPSYVVNWLYVPYMSGMMHWRLWKDHLVGWVCQGDFSTHKGGYSVLRSLDRLWDIFQPGKRLYEPIQAMIGRTHFSVAVVLINFKLLVSLASSQSWSNFFSSKLLKHVSSWEKVY